MTTEKKHRLVSRKEKNMSSNKRLGLEFILRGSLQSSPKIFSEPRSWMKVRFGQRKFWEQRGSAGVSDC